MPARTVEEQQDATCIAVVIICLLLAIISNVGYAKSDDYKIKEKYKDWFIPCYSISGGFVCIFMLKKCSSLKNKNRSNNIISVPV